MLLATVISELISTNESGPQKKGVAPTFTVITIMIFMSFFTSYLRPTMCPGVEANYGIRELSNIKGFFYDLK